MDVSLKFMAHLRQTNCLPHVLSEFESLHDNTLKVKFIQNLLAKNNLVSKCELPHPKHNALSNAYREEANCLYRANDYVAALEGYNKAICYAGAECISLGYSNRSAVYFKLKLYAECLDNVRLAREAGHADHILPKLADREAKCLEAMQKVANPKPKYQPELSCDANKDQPGMANCIELVTSEKYGRHYVAKDNLKVGDIVILERPYHAMLFQPCFYGKCAYCFSEKQLNLIPCPGCTKTMFCSQECLESAQKFHKTLCPIVDKLFEWPADTRFIQLGLRILLSAIADFGSVDALVPTTKEKMCKNAEETRQRKELDAFCAMETGLERISFSDAMLFAVVNIWLIDYTDLATRLSTVRSRATFLDIWLRYARIAKKSCNANHTEMIKPLKNGNIGSAKIGVKIMLLINLLNHSCAPNTTVVCCHDSLTGAMITKPVRKGEQLFISYNEIHHMKMPLEERQLKLFSDYKFVCTCEACTKDYPLMIALPPTRYPPKVTLSDMDLYQLMDHKRAAKKFGDCKNYLQNNYSNYPSKTLLATQMALEYSFSVLCKNYGLNVFLN